MARILLFALLLLGVETSAFAYRQPPTPQEMTYLDQAIAVDPSNSRLLQMRGLNFAVLGKKEKAIADFKAAQKLTPNEVRLYWTLGWALFNLDDYANALTIWEHAAALADQKRAAYKLPDSSDPDELTDCAWIPSTLALGYWAAGKETKALELFAMEAKVNFRYRDHDLFKRETNSWTEKEQAHAMLLFDAWKSSVSSAKSGRY